MVAAAALPDVDESIVALVAGFSGNAYVIDAE